MEIDIAKELVPEGVAVCVRVRLSGREANRLFLSGDTLVDLPLDGAVSGPGGEASPIPRSTIFLSEIAGLQHGFTRVFADESSADAFSSRVHAGLQSALEAQ